MEEITLFGIGATVLVTLTVEALKRFFKLPDDFAPWAALVLSALCAVASQVLVSFPESEPVIRTIVEGLLVFLMATGLYHSGKNIGENVVGALKR